MKYYIGKIKEQHGDHGDFENYETILFKTDECPNEYLDVIAYEWYDLNPSMEHLLIKPEEAKEFFERYKSNYEVFWNDCLTYCAGDYYEVPKYVWDCLRDKRIHFYFYIHKENSLENWKKLKEMYLK